MRTYYVLIIGAGLAGQRAALAAAEKGVSVGIVSKVHPVRSHSAAAAGGINAALKPGDSWEPHAYDTVKCSEYLGDQDVIELMCRAAPEEILHLEHLGVTYRDVAGELGTRAFGGASARAHSTSPTSPARHSCASSTNSCSSTNPPSIASRSGS